MGSFAGGHTHTHTKVQSKQTIRPTLPPLLLIQPHLTKPQPISPSLFILDRHPLNHLGIQIVNLIRQHRPLDKRLPGLEHQRKRSIHPRRGRKAQQPPELIRPHADPGVDVGINRGDETGQIGRHADDEGDDGAPVDAVPVAVDAAGLVEREGVVLAGVDDPEIHDHDGGDGAEEDAVRGHEVEEAAGAGEDFPGDERPREDGAEELPAPDVDVLREERGEVVRGGEGVGGDVDAEGGEREGEGGEEAAGAGFPVRDEGHGVPFEDAVFLGAGRGGGDADEGDEGEDYRQHGHVEELPFDRDAGVAGEIGLGWGAVSFFAIVHEGEGEDGGNGKSGQGGKPTWFTLRVA